jgi:hypothetical protein
MPSFEEVIEIALALVLIFVFLVTIIPVLGQATGANTTLLSFMLILLMIATVASLFKGR